MTKYFISIFVLISCFGLPQHSYAEVTLEEQAQEIERLLMAPCCWGGTVSEHSSPAAIKIKEETRAFLKSGKTKEEILNYYESQHGERILTNPKKVGFNWFLWVLPILASLAAALFIYMILKFWSPKQEKLNIDDTIDANSSFKENTESINKEDLDKYRKQIDDELYR